MNKTGKTSGVNPNLRRRAITYWVTRDSDVDGVLSSHVDVWLSKPTRYVLTPYGGAYWVVVGVDAPDDHHFGRFTLEQIRDAWKHAVPETDIECIRRDTMSDPE